MKTGKRWGRVPEAKAQSALGKVKLYEIAAKNPGLFKKAGAATIVDLHKLDEVIANLPDAEITTGLMTQRNAAPRTLTDRKK